MSKSFTCEIGNHNFDLTKADIDAYAKFGFEPLQICFPHQHQWRLAFRNDRFLHRRKCDLTGAEIISMYPQDAPYKVYEREAWFSDQWDPLEYGREFDFSRTFFEQYAELQRDVPRMALANVGSINSDYCNSCVFNKNCYLIFGGDRNEDCMFGSLPMYCKDCVDCDWTTRCELCYFCAYCENCYNCGFSFNSKNCSDCAFIEDCIGCKNCILSFNLRNKSYYIENKPYSKEEYFMRAETLLTESHSKQQKLWERFLELRKNRAVKHAHIINAENSSGELIFNSKNCRECYECIDSEDCHHCWTIFQSKDCFNSDYIGHGSVLNFNNISASPAYRVWFSYFTVSSSDIEYCECTNFSKNLFGCIGIRHGQYCILNKQYTKDEYFALRSRIIEHMKKTASPRGEREGQRSAGLVGPARAWPELKNQEWGKFFPPHLSTFPYNESTASVFFPLKKEEAIKMGFKWRDEQFAPQAQTFVMPDNILDIPDSILDETLACETTGKNFRIIPQELAFYRKQNIPIPRRHPDTRYFDRLRLRNDWQLFDRQCVKCGIRLKTPYEPARPEKVYCEKCYLGNL